MAAETRPDLDALVLAMHANDKLARERLVLIAKAELDGMFKSSDPADADDLRQEAILVVMMKLDEFDLDRERANAAKEKETKHAFLCWVARIGTIKLMQGEDRRKGRRVALPELATRQLPPDTRLDWNRRVERWSERVLQMRTPWREAFVRQVHEGRQRTYAQWGYLRRGRVWLRARLGSETPLNTEP